MVYILECPLWAINNDSLEANTKRGVAIVVLIYTAECSCCCPARLVALLGITTGL